MVVGCLNVGKSSLINRMSKQSKANVEDRPGYQGENRWFTIGKGFELLDTPGAFYGPKFEDKQVGEHLAFTGAVKDEVVDIEHLACRELETLREILSHAISQRYQLSL